MHLIKTLSAVGLASIGVAIYVQVDGISVPNSYPSYRIDATDEPYIYHSLNGGQSNELSSNALEDVIDEASEDTERLHIASPTSPNIKDEEDFDATLKAEPLLDVVTTIEVKSGDSIIKLLRSNGLSGSETTSLIYRSGIKASVFKISIGDVINITKNKHNSVSVIEVRNTPLGYYKISPKGDKWVSEFIEYKTTYRQRTYGFELTSSLYVDAKSVGMKDTEIANLQAIFKDTLNFSRMQAGTDFSVLVEQAFKNEKSSGEFKILAAKITYADTIYTAYQFKEDGELNYYDSNGDSLLPSFRKHPVDNVRITSHFNPFRKHPVLDIVRPHRGTDYGGAGKPIKALGDGVIKFAGKRGAFGNAIIIDHGNGIRTLSAHQKRFEKGIKTGVRVKKGQVIGYIGSTGLVTGPHLHFELHVNGKHVDPLKYPLPVSSKVKDKAKFLNVVEKYNKELSTPLVKA
ncbi:peptidoglycan DD-metalloendopeptidase family protein [Vibrio sp. D431a]|uniref:M23 family metallopeptidase n=1 Tax=Vibrio sp. D431a TaxID=2837388 RepID=UPI0025543A9F|nr:peptidoglycan DD-metalloendopeptidase family protein [Vibrio sp. D431a]MDK9793870.1 peptidoglycan DD-metalloendopeptidase family protein [Vibrio sp. D431a]